MELGNGEAGFDLREDVPVAVVVVADVVVPELRRLRAFEGRAQGFAIPAGDDIDAIGIERGDQDDDGVLEDRANVRRVLRQHAVREFDGGMSGADFAGVDGAGDEDDGLALREKRFGLLRGSETRVGETALDVDVAVEMFDSVGVGNGRGDEGSAFGGLAEFIDLDAVARFGEGLEVADDLVPIENGLVVADWVAEVAGGRRDGGRGWNNKPGNSGEEKRGDGFHGNS